MRSICIFVVISTQMKNGVAGVPPPSQALEVTPAADGFVTSYMGTKGGRTRRSPIDREQAAAVVHRAIDWAQESRGTLIASRISKRI
jgi:hypothetical protein